MVYSPNTYNTNTVYFNNNNNKKKLNKIIMETKEKKSFCDYNIL